MNLHDSIIEALRTVHDPEIPVNIHDLGLIYGLDISDDGAVLVRMTLTAPNCPMADVIVAQVTAKVRAVEGVTSADVELVWEPKWEPEMMTEAAKLELEFTGHTAPAHLKRDKFSKLTVNRKRSER
ncbi:MAG: DUF59 domain-containing protein [Planctomycetes bacterium]|nr:DUF59 domain-containing protein [Planctomycetota bacterium]